VRSALGTGASSSASASASARPGPTRILAGHWCLHVRCVSDNRETSVREYGRDPLRDGGSRDGSVSSAFTEWCTTLPRTLPLARRKSSWHFPHVLDGIRPDGPHEALPVPALTTEETHELLAPLGDESSAARVTDVPHAT